MVDLDQEAPAYPGSSSLAALALSQPRLDDLRPRRSGVAVLPNGSAKPKDTTEILKSLVSGWPAVVFRQGASLELPPFLLGTPVIPVTPLFPGFLYPSIAGPAVYQAMSAGPPPRTARIMLPPLDRSHIYLSHVGRPRISPAAVGERLEEATVAPVTVIRTFCCQDLGYGSGRVSSPTLSWNELSGQGRHQGHFIPL